jgi:hypothetical protein
MGQDGRQRVLQDFTGDRMVASYRQQYQTLARS